MALIAAPSLQRIYRIHPGIGVARIGNSRAQDEAGYFIGPEVPDIEFVPPGGRHRDANNDIRRQGARFRIYEYTYAVSSPPQPLLPYPDQARFVREITADDATIQWHVHLANRKSHNGVGNPVHNDPGELTVSGINQSVDVVGAIFGESVQLGTLKTDDKGRLIVLGGFGRSGSPENLPITGLFSRGWYDDVSDGSVRVTLTLKGADTRQTVEAAWVLVGVPRFAQPVSAIVTMYDLAYDVATKLPVPNTLVQPTGVSFTRDIYPVLFRAVMMQWVISTSRMGHSGAAAGNFLEPTLFDLLRNNDPTPGSPARLAREHVSGKLRPLGNMPDLSGCLTLTDTQLNNFKQWAAGNFVADWSGPPAVEPFAALTPLRQTQSLDMTGLWTAVGGAFMPGMEAGSVMSQTATYQQPFRINQAMPPGSLTEGLSIPWQADYRDCGRSWWPSGRPDEVSANGTSFHEWLPLTMTQEQLVQDWWKLGFLHKRTVSGADVVIEEERLLP